jgi:hypothetical protein
LIDECTVSYGELGNIDLLRLYGFAVPHNPHNKVHIQPKGGDPVSFPLSYEEPISTSLLEYTAKRFASSNRPSSESNEDVKAAGLDWLIAYLSSVVDNKATSLEDDSKMAETIKAQSEENKDAEKVPFWFRQALTLRMEEKKIILNSVDTLKALQKDFSSH